MAITGGSESVFSYGFLKAWEAMRVISPDTCRPFSKDRSGLILGEGAGAMVLETEESAKRRGARVYGEIAGFDGEVDAMNDLEIAIGLLELTQLNARRHLCLLRLPERGRHPALIERMVRTQGQNDLLMRR